MSAQNCQYRKVVGYTYQPGIHDIKSDWIDSQLHEFTRDGQAIVETRGGDILLLPLGGLEFYQIRMGHRPPEPSFTDEMEKFTKEFTMSQAREEAS